MMPRTRVNRHCLLRCGQEGRFLFPLSDGFLPAPGSKYLFKHVIGTYRSNRNSAVEAKVRHWARTDQLAHAAVLNVDRIRFRLSLGLVGELFYKPMNGDSVAVPRRSGWWLGIGQVAGHLSTPFSKGVWVRSCLALHRRPAPAQMGAVVGGDIASLGLCRRS